ncbi:MAG: DUF3592 domain-containing protein [Deltaproteobacteria bacterium]|nr:DUF3592 domain-containing protein [Deltaproteobacteria bacterium]
MFERIKAFLWGAGLIVVGIAILIWSGTIIVTAADIAQNGKVTTAKVISSRMETRRSGRRSVRVVYVHQIQFDGKRANMDLVAPRPDGSQMKIIYLKSDPGDPRIFVSRDWGDVLGWTTFNWLLALGLPIVFFVAGGGWLFAAFRRRGRARRAAGRVVVTPPQAAAPDPYPPAAPAYPPAAPAYPPAAPAYPPPAAQYPAAPAGQYGTPSAQYPQAPTPYPPASGQYPAQPGQYPPAPAPGQWPPPGQGGGYPPQR